MLCHLLSVFEIQFGPVLFCFELEPEPQPVLIYLKSAKNWTEPHTIGCVQFGQVGKSVLTNLATTGCHAAQVNFYYI